MYFIAFVMKNKTAATNRQCFGYKKSAVVWPTLQQKKSAVFWHEQKSAKKNGNIFGTEFGARIGAQFRQSVHPVPSAQARPSISVHPYPSVLARPSLLVGSCQSVHVLPSRSVRLYIFPSKSACPGPSSPGPPRQLWKPMFSSVGKGVSGKKPN